MTWFRSALVLFATAAIAVGQASSVAQEKSKPKPAPKGSKVKATANATAPKRMDDVPLIPRRAFFGNPEKARARISPDGKQLAYLAPVDGVLNVWVGPADKPDQAKAVTFDKHRGITEYFWAFTNKHILYVQDKNGDAAGLLRAGRF